MVDTCSAAEDIAGGVKAGVFTAMLGELVAEVIGVAILFLVALGILILDYL